MHILHIRNLGRFLGRFSAALASVVAAPTMAALPAFTPPGGQNAPAQQDLLGNAQGLADQGGDLLGLILTMGGILWGGYVVVAVINDVRRGKSGWGEAISSSIGSLVGVLVVFLMAGLAAGVI